MFDRRPTKKSIGAKDMRKLEEDVAVKPFNSKHKVYIFEDASLLTEEAQNTFLKTFENRREYSVFILITENSASPIADNFITFYACAFSVCV